MSTNPISDRSDGDLLSAMEALLEHVQAPAIIANAVRKEIVAANLAALQSSGLSKESARGKPLTLIFPEIQRWNTAEFSLPKNVFTLFQPLNRPIQQVLWQATPLGEGSHYWLVTFQEPVRAGTGKVSLLHGPSGQECPMRWEKFVSALEATSIQESVGSLLEGIIDLLSAEWGAVYFVEDSKLRLLTARNAPPRLPAEMSSLLMENLDKVLVHRPARDITTPLRAAVRSTPTPYFLSIPLKGKSVSGMLGVTVLGYYHPPNSQVVEHARRASEYCSIVMDFLRQREEFSKQQALLQELQSINKSLFNGLEEGVMLFDRSLKLVEMNAAAEEMLGYKQGVAKGFSLGDVLPSNVPLEPLARVALLRCQPQETAAKILKTDGDDLPCHVKFVPHSLVEGGRPAGLLVVMNDLSESIMCRKHTAQLERRAALGDVMASFAHEIRNPLNNISMGIQWLAMNLEPGAPEHKWMTSLQKDVEQITHLVNNLLDYTRARQMQFRSLDVVELLKQVMRRLKPRFDKYKIQTELRVEGKVPMVKGDRLMLERVFVNLLDNAIKALAEQNDERFIAVRIKPFRSGEGIQWVEVDVMDTGPGFTEEIRKKLFQPFFTTREDGTGLGLAITKQIITSHQGSIEAESYPGGTIFRVKLRAVGEKHGL